MPSTGISPSLRAQAQQRVEGEQQVARSLPSGFESGNARERTSQVGRMPQPAGTLRGAPSDEECSRIFAFLWFIVAFLGQPFGWGPNPRQAGASGGPANPQSEPGLEGTTNFGNGNQFNGNVLQSHNHTHNGDIKNIGTHGTNNFQSPVFN